MSADPFEVLGVRHDATLAEVRSARRRLAAEFHPDHGGDAARMGEINAAFDAVEFQLLHPQPESVSAPPATAPEEAVPPRRYQGVQYDAPSFTIDTLPAEAFEALLVVTSWMGEVLVDDPPYLLEVHLTDPAPCWCRLDLVPDAGGSTVTLTVASIGGDPAPDVEDVRDRWVANLNQL
ncbi:MAG: DnaJ domain-containing protein [Ilumatobacteraceae bacterium]